MKTEQKKALRLLAVPIVLNFLEVLTLMNKPEQTSPFCFANTPDAK